MKLEIYGEKEEEGKTVRLRLVKDDDDDIQIYAVDKNGEKVLGGLIGWFNRKGKLNLCSGVNPDLGFQLDEDSRIKFDEE